ncbi:MAG: zinc-ribbon domain-containing protein, partial [Bacteroidota bacterium]|nr:zinc-ribbon domain-containing protein [Bacteroidota bacterium]
MKLFQCSNCKNPVYFENTTCEKCGHNLGSLNALEEIVSFPAE